jgi:hypothetical protein
VAKRSAEKTAEISILLPSISPELETVLNFDLTGRNVGMGTERRNLGTFQRTLNRPLGF